MNLLSSSFILMTAFYVQESTYSHEYMGSNDSFELYVKAYSLANPQRSCFGSGLEGKRNVSRLKRLRNRLDSSRGVIIFRSGVTKVETFEREFQNYWDEQNQVMIISSCGAAIDRSVSENALGRMIRSLENQLRKEEKPK